MTRKELFAFLKRLWSAIAGAYRSHARSPLREENRAFVRSSQPPTVIVHRRAGQPRATMSIPIRRIAGALLIGGAGMCLAGAAIPYMFRAAPSPKEGSLVAVGLVFMVFGLICAFPSALTDGSEHVSAMRVVVLLISSSFVLLVVKNGWAGEKVIDGAWKTIIGALMGGKAAQSFAEAIGGSPGSPPKIGAPDYDRASTTPPYEK